MISCLAHAKFICSAAQHTAGTARGRGATRQRLGAQPATAGRQPAGGATPPLAPPWRPGAALAPWCSRRTSDHGCVGGQAVALVVPVLNRHFGDQLGQLVLPGLHWGPTGRTHVAEECEEGARGCCEGTHSCAGAAPARRPSVHGTAGAGGGPCLLLSCCPCGPLWPAVARAPGWCSGGP